MVRFIECNFAVDAADSSTCPPPSVCIVTASNSDMRQVGSTFIQIKLVVDKGGNIGKEDIHMGQ